MKLLEVTILILVSFVSDLAMAKENLSKLNAPPKECHRFEGRSGYYGNPWCSKEEQDRWDRWEAERLRRGASR